MIFWARWILRASFWIYLFKVHFNFQPLINGQISQIVSSLQVLCLKFYICAVQEVTQSSLTTEEPFYPDCFPPFYIMQVVKVICSRVGLCLELLNLENAWKNQGNCNCLKSFHKLLTYCGAVWKFRMSSNNGMVDLNPHWLHFEAGMLT